MARNMPEVGVRYPVRLGRSMLQPPSSGGREYFAVRFDHLPENIAVARPGMIRRVGDKLYVHLPAGDDKGMKFQGTRMSPSSPNVSEYLLIFHEGVLYLERLTAIFCHVRSVGGRVTDAPTVPPVPDMEADSDPWEAPSVSVSPVTQEEDGGSEEHRSPARTPTAQKGLKGTTDSARKTERGILVSGKRRLGAVGGIKKSTGSKRVPGKTVRPPPERGSDGESSDSSSCSSSNASSSSESGDSSSNDSDNSENFTDCSSDED